MKSGLGDRNNPGVVAGRHGRPGRPVSMKSGLGDRNNPPKPNQTTNLINWVSMKSGLGDRNNELAKRVDQVRKAAKSQ